MAFRFFLLGLCMASMLERSGAAYSPLVVQAKWRACNGYATNYAYITGTDTNYKASWAVNTSTSALLDKTKNSHSDLEAACAALLPDGYIGEIYEIIQDPNCTGCLRMAIYPSTEDGMHLGTVSDTGDQHKWVCGKGAPPPVRPSCPVTPLTCGEAKAAYKESGCCGNPTATFNLGRRLAAPSSQEDK